MTTATQQQKHEAEGALIRASEVRHLAGGVTGDTLRRWLKLPGFPQPVVINRRLYFHREEVLAYLRDRAAEGRFARRSKLTPRPCAAPADLLDAAREAVEALLNLGGRDVRERGCFCGLNQAKPCTVCTLRAAIAKATGE